MTDKEKIKYYQKQLEYLEAENAYLKKIEGLSSKETRPTTREK